MSFRLRAAASLAFVALAAMSAPAADEAPLTNEDVVRMVAAGTPEAEILDAIHERPEAFDLADDMLDELKLAGVSAAVVAAMEQKRAKSAPRAAPTTRQRGGHAPLVVSLVGTRTLRVPPWADEDAKARLRLPKDNEQRQVKDLAVFLACSAPEHIPDLWRSKTPLGRDMVFVSRHEMLAFVAGDTPEGKAPRLTLPARLEAEVDDADAHDLVLGVAARIGDHWVQLAIGSLPKTVIGPGAKPLTGRIERVGHAFEFKIELTAPR